MVRGLRGAARRRRACDRRQGRALIRAALARGKLDDGACGPAAMDVDGEVHRAPFVLWP